MGLDLWYNKGVKREQFKSERGKAAGKTTPQSSRKKPLDKHHRMWYNIGGKKDKSPVARSRGTARGSMVETFTVFQSIKQTTYLDN